MTHIYRTDGELQVPVLDLAAAQAYLREDDMTKYVDADFADAVHHVQWNLTDESHWEVTVIANRLLTDDESAELSDWISGQNSDGLGEGFEQQSFADYYDPDDPDDDAGMASFDWRTNPCELHLVEPADSGNVDAESLELWRDEGDGQMYLVVDGGAYESLEFALTREHAAELGLALLSWAVNR